MKTTINPLFIKAISVSLLLLGLSGCAVIRQATCNTNSAYAAGINDGQTSQAMDPDFASICQTNQTQINNAYRRGYTTGLKHKTRQPSTTGGDQGWSCLDDFGQQVCGYNCIKDPFDKVYCGKHRDDNCVTDPFNKTMCGLHCRINQYNAATCEKERYSKGSN